MLRLIPKWFRGWRKIIDSGYLYDRIIRNGKVDYGKLTPKHQKMISEYGGIDRCLVKTKHIYDGYFDSCYIKIYGNVKFKN